MRASDDTDLGADTMDCVESFCQGHRRSAVL